jgi:hypothetical protein
LPDVNHSCWTLLAFPKRRNITITTTYAVVSLWKSVLILIPIFTHPHPLTSTGLYALQASSSIVMTALDEKPRAMPVNVLTIPRPAKAYQHPNQCIDVLSTVEDLESTRSLSPATTIGPDGSKYPGDVNPLSPFYNPSPTRLSLDAQKSESRRDVHLIPAYDTDLEAASTPPASAISCDKPVAKPNANNFHCAVWPNQHAMRMKKKAMRRAKGRYMMCGWLAPLSKPTRITIKTLFALVLIGAAVGIAIGISKAVGGGVWRNSHNTNAPIGGTHH